MNKFLEDSSSFRYFFIGVKFVFHNLSLLKYMCVQMLVFLFNIILAMCVIYKYSYSTFIYFFPWAIDPDTWYYVIISYLLLVLYDILFSLLSLYLFLMLTQVITAPLKTLLSEKTVEIYSGAKGFSKRNFYQQALFDVIYEVKKQFFFLFVLVLLGLIFLIPGIGQIVSPIAIIVFTMFSLTYDILDYPMEKDEDSLRKRLKIVFYNPSIWISYGGSIYLLMMIPFLNIFLWPVTIVSGTILYIEKFRDKENSHMNT